MTKLAAVAVLTVVLVACASPVERTDSCATDSASPSGSSLPAEQPRKDETPAEKTENEKNSFEYCAGSWNCFDYGQNWLRRNGDACQVGTMIRIFADGSAMHENEKVGPGTWTGDAYDLKLHFPALGESRPIVSCHRESK